MLLLSRITVAIVLIITIHYVDGNQKIVHVSELIGDEDFLSSDDGNSSLIYVVHMENVLVIPLIMHWLILLVMFSSTLQLM